MGGCWCCAEGCENKARKTKGVCYHRFPSNSALREKWLCAVRRVNWSPSKNACVCSDHFTPDSYKQSVYLMEEFGLAKPNYRRYLKSDAVPTVFWYADHSASLPDPATKQRRSELIQEPPDAIEQLDLSLKGGTVRGPRNEATTSMAGADKAVSDTSAAVKPARSTCVWHLGSRTVATQTLKNPSVGIQASRVLLQDGAVQTR